jgi:hypothetical protein
MWWLIRKYVMIH